MAYFVRRIAFFVLTLWAAVTLNFIIPRLQPGDPAQDMVTRLAGQSEAIDPAAVRAVHIMLGLPTGSIFEQYVEYLKSVVAGDFGISYSYFPYTVMHMIGQAMPWTIVLVGVTQVVGFVAGTLLGAAAAWKRNGKFDSVVSLGSTFLGTLPFFWIGRTTPGSRRPRACGRAGLRWRTVRGSRSCPTSRDSRCRWAASSAAR